MINKMRKMLRNRKGFTIIEIVIVIAILGILAMILLPKGEGMKTQAKIFADKQSIASINDAIALHTAVNGWDNIVGQTSMSVTSPIKNGDSVTVILQYLKDKGGMIEQTATIFNTLGHTYDSSQNRVN